MLTEIVELIFAQPQWLFEEGKPGYLKMWRVNLTGPLLPRIKGLALAAELIGVLEALRTAGALHAELVVQ